MAASGRQLPPESIQANFGQQINLNWLMSGLIICCPVGPQFCQLNAKSLGTAFGAKQTANYPKWQNIGLTFDSEPMVWFERHDDGGD